MSEQPEVVVTPVPEETALFKALSAHGTLLNSPQEFVAEANRIMDEIRDVKFKAVACDAGLLIAVLYKSSMLASNLLSVRSRDALFGIVDEASSNWRQLTTTNKVTSDFAKRVSNAATDVVF